MILMHASYEILTPFDGQEVLKLIERIGRVCYKSEDKITDDSCIAFVKKLIQNGHEAMIEHFSFSVRFVCDRGVSHEIVRHRLASFAQESTRYCNYGKQDEITIIKPLFWYKDSDSYDTWLSLCKASEAAYMKLIAQGASPQEARSVLPNSLKTELIMTANLREWRHFLKLRTASTAHPQMQEIARPLLIDLRHRIPVVFDDLRY